MSEPARAAWRTLLAAASCALCLCTPSAREDERGKSTTTATTTTSTSTALGPLPALQRARMESLFDAMHRVAAVWPWMTDIEPCVLLLEASVQWGLDCEQAPAQNFTRVAGQFRHKPVFMRTGGTITAAGRELSTAEFLAQNPASAHVDDALARRTDLPSGRAWLVLGSLEALTAFHPAFAGASTEEWLSVALHEFLHSAAMRLPNFATELERINTKATDPSPLAALYESDAVYRALVQREYDLLVTAAARAPGDAARDRRALRDWREFYDERRMALSKRARGAELVHDDSLFTYVEGVARYVESAFLVDASQHPHAIAGDPRYTGFARWSGRGYAAMPNRQLDPAYYYAIGFHLALLLERIDPSWKQRAAVHGNWLIGVAHEIDKAGK